MMEATGTADELRGWARRWLLFTSGAGRWRRRWLPYIVWHDQEIDVVVTFRQDKLPSGGVEQAFGALFGGRLYEIQQQLREMGIDFDSGMGHGGRDWEWDWSLSGPISVRFRNRAQEPGRRRARPRPALVVDNERTG